jgi:hypothetical protein
MSRRNGVPRDFTLLRRVLTPGAKVWIWRHGIEHRATFLGDRFRTEDGKIFTSPFAFSTHVTRLYTDTAAPPSGWSVIRTVVNEHTQQVMALDTIYDNGI